MTSPDWRTGVGYEWTRECGLTALAWEFLRYNPDYRRFVQSVRDATDAPPGLGRWGLRFRGGPRLRLAPHARVLEPRTGRRRGALHCVSLMSAAVCQDDGCRRQRCIPPKSIGRTPPVMG